MYKIFFVILMSACSLEAFKLSLNPFKQLEYAEENRQAFWNGVSNIFSAGPSNNDEYGNNVGDNCGQDPRFGSNETHFNALAGTPPQEFIDLRDYLNFPQKYIKAGVRPFKGILLVGPPGSGKTSLVRSLAQETNCELLATSGSEFGAVYKGVGMLQVKKLFADARALAMQTRRPTIIFFDDFDAIGNRNDYRADPQTIGELLNQLDGYNENDSFIVVAATNNPELIDPGLKRRGRFDKIIEIGTPDEHNRLQIIEFYLRKRSYDKTIDLHYFAEQTQNFTPADLKVMVETASMNALRAKRDMVNYDDMRGALEELANSIILGSDKKHGLKRINLDTNKPKGFSLLAGAINQEIEDLVLQLRHPERFERLGVERPRGFLFVGPPGTGKTSLARAIAEETNCDFINCSASEFIELYVGVGAQRVRELFDDARKRARNNKQKTTIVFIDDLDAIGRRSSSPGDTETQRTLVELLNQMDGFTKDDNIIVIGATNNPIAIDPALKRPGRLEIIIEVPLPDMIKREEILAFYAASRPLDYSVDLHEYAVLCKGFSPADLKMLVNHAARLALRDNAEQLSSKHFDTAFEVMLQRKQLAEEGYI